MEFELDVDECETQNPDWQAAAALNPLASYHSFHQLDQQEQDELIKDVSEVLHRSVDEKWFVPSAELTHESVLAQTENSTVCRCKWRGDTIVLKRLRAKHISTLKILLQEMTVWSTLRHPRLVQFLGCSYVDVNAEFSILMEHVRGANLSNVISGQMRSGLGGQLTDHERCHMCTQLISAFCFLHSCSPPVIYRDLKPDNVMVCEHTLDVKLTDFGLSRFMPAPLDTACRMTPGTGTLRYMSPEVANGARMVSNRTCTRLVWSFTTYSQAASRLNTLQPPVWQHTTASVPTRW